MNNNKMIENEQINMAMELMQEMDKVDLKFLNENAKQTLAEPVALLSNPNAAASELQPQVNKLNTQLNADEPPKNSACLYISLDSSDEDDISTDEASETDTNDNGLLELMPEQSLPETLEDAISLSDDDEQYDEYEQWQNDEMNEEQIQETVSDDATATPAYSHVCDICNESFPYLAQLKNHRNIHGESVFKCALCNALFSRRYSLLKHSLSHKRNQKLHRCTECPKAFDDASRLDKHTLVHTAKRNHVCSVCGSAFLKPTNLRAHMQYHRPPKYKCYKCSKAFHSSGDLRRHERRCKNTPTAVTEQSVLQEQNIQQNYLNGNEAQTQANQNAYLNENELEDQYELCGNEYDAECDAGRPVKCEDQYEQSNEVEDYAHTISNAAMEDEEFELRNEESKVPLIDIEPVIKIELDEYVEMPANSIDDGAIQEEQFNKENHLQANAMSTSIQGAIALDEDNQKNINLLPVDNKDGIAKEHLQPHTESCRRQDLKPELSLKVVTPEQEFKTAYSMRKSSFEPEEQICIIKDVVQQIKIECDADIAAVGIKVEFEQRLQEANENCMEPANQSLDKSFDMMPQWQDEYDFELKAEEEDDNDDLYVINEAAAENQTSNMERKSSNDSAHFEVMEYDNAATDSPNQLNDSGNATELANFPVYPYAELHAPNADEKQTNTCSVCGLYFKILYDLSKHKHTVHFPRPFQCTLCNALFTRRSNLKQHVLLHVNPNIHKCNVCSKSFKCRSYLRRHKTTHNDQFPYECADCGDRFDTLVGLQDHVNNHRLQRGLL